MYTKAQAERGKVLYAKACAACHMLPGVSGKPTHAAPGPDLGGDIFFTTWDGKKAGTLFNVILRTMPNDFSMELDEAKTADVVSLILQANKFPDGAKELTLDSAQAATIVKPGLWPRLRSQMTEISKDVLIDAAPADVAAVMFDPLRDTEWMTSVNTSEPQSPGITVGAEVRRTSVVAGADVAWTTVVEAFHFPHILRLTIGGGHTGAVKYEVQRSGTGSIARVRAASDKDLFGFDLDKLKALIEYP